MFYSAKDDSKPKIRETHRRRRSKYYSGFYSSNDLIFIPILARDTAEDKAAIRQELNSTRRHAKGRISDSAHGQAPTIPEAEPRLVLPSRQENYVLRQKESSFLLFAILAAGIFMVAQEMRKGLFL